MTFERPITYLITSGQASPENFEINKNAILSAVRRAVDCGVSLVQLREKRLTAKQLFELATEASKLTRGNETRLLVNDRADIAVAAGADGVHLTSTSLPAGLIRRAFGDDLFIGVSTHTVDEVAIAKQDGADFAVFGPVFAVPEKSAPVGIEALRSACDRAGDFPVLALGGIDLVNYRSALDAGAAGIAAIRLFGDADLSKVMRKIANE
ncbi:MAG: thiamine phosphate synthase [Pyrinomonadaceae bacterium]|nr:thiamine phosphate synthase [Pyrinomonadaceae bacterium]MBP6211711.1 thiamine phosphate synthase [Pyrinomonadaceae bacterium]